MKPLTLAMACALVAGPALADPCEAPVTGYKPGATVASTVETVTYERGLVRSRAGEVAFLKPVGMDETEALAELLKHYAPPSPSEHGPVTFDDDSKLYETVANGRALVSRNCSEWWDKGSPEPGGSPSGGES